MALEAAALASAEAARYWEELLAGSTPLRLPRAPRADRPTTPGRLGVVETALDNDLVAQLKHLAVAAGVPLKSVLLAAHLRVLALVTGQQDVLSGVVAHGRPEEADGQRLLGLFLNTLPLRVTLDARDSGRALVQKVFAAEQAALPFRRYPAGRLKHPSGQPPFEAAFNYNHFHVYQALAGREDLELSDPRVFEYTNFALLVNFDQAPAGAGLALRLNYDAGQFDAAEIETLQDYYRRALVALAAAPDAPLSHERLLGDERQTVVARFNATAVAYPAGETLLTLFARQVAATPAAAAIAFEGQALSYAELDRRSSQLGHWLKDQGIGPDRVVGVLAERSLEMLVAIYGVLKAGAAYLPLEPDAPPRRLAGHSRRSAAGGRALSGE